MTRDSAIGVLDDMVRARAINGDIVTVLKKNYEEINAARTHAQAAATREYRLMNQKLKKPM
jgi:hypothetical protein